VNEERELARKNAVAGWLLAALFVVLAGGVVAVAFIFNAVSSY
jgi:hypothetical protein